MKKILVIILLCIGFTILPTKQSHAVIIEVVKQAIIKAIKAIDLQVQRLQNKTIWLQNAQKNLENTMSKLQLDEITDWVEKNREQYANYFDELNRVKAAINGYHQVKSIMHKQLLIVDEYKRAFALFKMDKNFTPQELDHMLRVYTGIVNACLQNIDQLFLVVREFNTKMTDGRRLQIIEHVSDQIDENLMDLRAFNTGNIKISLQRTRNQHEVDIVKQLYGLN